MRVTGHGGPNLPNCNDFNEKLPSLKRFLLLTPGAVFSIKKDMPNDLNDKHVSEKITLHDDPEQAIGHPPAYFNPHEANNITNVSKDIRDLCGCPYNTPHAGLHTNLIVAPIDNKRSVAKKLFQKMSGDYTQIYFTYYLTFLAYWDYKLGANARNPLMPAERLLTKGTDNTHRGNYVRDQTFFVTGDWPAGMRQLSLGGNMIIKNAGCYYVCTRIHM